MCDSLFSSALFILMCLTDISISSADVTNTRAASFLWFSHVGCLHLLLWVVKRFELRIINLDLKLSDEHRMQHETTPDRVGFWAVSFSVLFRAYYGYWNFKFTDLPQNGIHILRTSKQSSVTLSYVARDTSAQFLTLLKTFIRVLRHPQTR